MKKNSVLVVYSGWLGDLIWIVPVIHALKTVFDAVSLVVSEVQAPLAEIMKNGLLDEVYVDSASRRPATARAVRRDARARGVDTFIDLKGRGKTGIYMPWGRNLNIIIPHRRDAREYALARLLHPRASGMPARANGHMVDAYLSGLRALHVRNAPVSFELPFDEKTIKEGEQIAESRGLRASRSVSLNPGSAQFSKIWPAGNYRRLADILKYDMGCTVVLMGARDFAPNGDYDLRVSREFFNHGADLNLVEKTGLPVDAYLLGSGAFTVSVGNDSFAGHMAGSANETLNEASGAVRAGNGRWYKANYTVTLFGPTNPGFCRPYDPTGVFNTVIMPESYPSGCVYDRKAHTCPRYGGRRCFDRAHCMQNISVEQVAAAVEKKLGEHDKKRSDRIVGSG